MSALGQPQTGSPLCSVHDAPCPACTLRYRAVIRGLEQALEQKRRLLEQALDEAAKLRNQNFYLRNSATASVGRLVPITVDPLEVAVAEGRQCGRL